MIVSIPHSGTRTLNKILNNGELQFIHFGDNDLSDLMELCPKRFDMPLRSFDDVLESWKRRGRDIEDLARRYAEAIDIIATYPGRIYYHNMRQYPVLVKDGDY